VLLGTGISSISNALPGDLVFFGPIAPGEPHHVGIYVGNNQMIDAPNTGTLVRQESINGFGPIFAIRRLVSAGGTGDPGTTDPNQAVTFNYAQLEGIWVLAGGNPQVANMAAAIAMAESGGISNASNTNTNGSIDRGLWQINSTNGSGSSFDIMTNARTAVSMSNNGASWRQWCTAYSDARCGTKGGTYLGAGSPYIKFLQTGVPPDTSVPINGTNANTPGAMPTTADLTGCSIVPPDFACYFASSGGKIVKLIIGTILNPLIGIVAGTAGIVAGGTMMAFGMVVMVLDVGGKSLGSTAVQGGAMLAGQPEIAAAVGGGGLLTGKARTQVAGKRSGIIEGRQQRLGEATSQRAMERTRASQQGQMEVISARGAQSVAAARGRSQVATDELLRRDAALYDQRRARRTS
jgi:hypothetical protein